METIDLENRRVETYKKSFADGSIFKSRYAMYSFGRYRNCRINLDPIIPSVIFCVLCFQILAIGMQPWNSSFWEKDDRLCYLKNFFGYFSFTLLLPSKLTGFYEEAVIVFILYIVDFIVFLITFLWFVVKRRVPKNLLYISRFLESLCSTILLPCYGAFCGYITLKAENRVLVLFLMFLLVLKLLKIQLTCVLVENSLSVTIMNLYNTSFKVSLRYLYFTLISSFASNSFTESFIKKGYPSIGITLFIILITIFELSSFNWLIQEQENLIYSTLITASVTSTLITLAFYYEKMQGDGPL